MQDDAVQEGLRQRKKSKVRNLIERTMLEMVLERGYENVTVEDVCQAAEVSKKTFFNYFRSKDAVIRGTLLGVLTIGELVGRLEERKADNYLDVVVDTVQCGWAEGVEGADEVRELRRRIMNEMPYLLFLGQRDVSELQFVMSEAMTVHLTRNPSCRNMPEMPLADEVLVASSVLMSMMRTRFAHYSRYGKVFEPCEVRDLIVRVAGGAHGGRGIGRAGEGEKGAGA